MKIRDKLGIAIIGCGYVGCALGEALVKAGHHVIGTTTDPQRVREIEARGITPAVLEHARTDLLHAVLSDRTAVYLTIAAGRKHGNYPKVYLEGAHNVLHACKDAPVTRIIYTSSTQVYGQSDGSWVDESSATEPQTANGRVLLAAEQALLDGAHAHQSGERSGEEHLSRPAVGPRKDSRFSHLCGALVIYSSAPMSACMTESAAEGRSRRDRGL